MKLSAVRFAPLGLSLFALTLLAPHGAPLIAAQSAGFRAEPPASMGEHPTDLKIPVGTILPVRLNHALSSKSAEAGQEVNGRIMQDVPLPNHERDSRRSEGVRQDRVGAASGKRRGRENLFPLRHS